MLSRDLQGTLERALMHAKGHTYATLDHLLLALIDDPNAARVLLGCALNLEEVRNILAMNIERDYGLSQTLLLVRDPPPVFSAPYNSRRSECDHLE
jgi:ATP-dependent Clp protease ATP-binding subunit ClpA